MKVTDNIGWDDELDVRILINFKLIRHDLNTLRVLVTMGSYEIKMHTTDRVANSLNNLWTSDLATRDIRTFKDQSVYIYGPTTWGIKVYDELKHITHE